MVLPKNDTESFGKVYRAVLGSFGPVLTRLAPLKAQFLPFLESIGPVLAASGRAQKLPILDPKIANFGPKNCGKWFLPKCSETLRGGDQRIVRPFRAPFDGQGLELSTSHRNISGIPYGCPLE